MDHRLRAILLGGPRHLTELEIPSPPHPLLVMPDPEPFPTIQTLCEREPTAWFPTKVYYLQSVRTGPYAIYLSED